MERRGFGPSSLRPQPNQTLTHTVLSCASTGSLIVGRRQLDEEQDMQAPQPERVGRQEIAGDHRRRLRAQ